MSFFPSCAKKNEHLLLMPWWTFESDVAYFIACIAIVILLALLALFIIIVFNLYALDILYFEIVLNKKQNFCVFSRFNNKPFIFETFLQCFLSLLVIHGQEPNDETQDDMCYAKVCSRSPTDHTLSTFN